MASRSRNAGDRYERFLALLVKTVAAFLGLGLIAYEALVGGNIEFALLGVGIAGLPFGNAMENFMRWIVTLRPAEAKPPVEDNRRARSEDEDA